MNIIDRQVPKSAKYTIIIDTSTELFMRYGVKRVTVEEICRTANISKMTFYKYFKNKTELTKYLLNQIFSQQMTEYREIIAQQVSFPEKVKQIIQLKHRQINMMSREFFHNILKNPDPEIVEFIEKLTEESLNEVLNDFKAARENGDIRRDVKPEFILYFLNHTTEMAKDENLMRLYNSPDELAVELMNLFFYGILTPKADRES